MYLATKHVKSSISTTTMCVVLCGEGEVKVKRSEGEM
jgi:hypothetical protein